MPLPYPYRIQSDFDLSKDKPVGWAGFPAHAVLYSLITVSPLSAWAIELPILPTSELVTLLLPSCVTRDFSIPNLSVSLCNLIDLLPLPLESGQVS